jgi:hypothetical protein
MNQPLAQGMWNGQILVDWRNVSMIRHTSGCLLCCNNRIRRSDGRLKHPDPCPQCGYGDPNHVGPDRCRLCSFTAHFRDEQGRPVHKTCFEQEIAEQAARREGGQAA